MKASRPRFPWLALCLAVSATVAASFRLEAEAPPPRLQSPAPSSAPADEAWQQARVVCTGCHALPPPDILPRRVWRDEFVRMAYIRDGRLPPTERPAGGYDHVPLPDDMQRALPFYTSRAPERLAAPDAWPAPSDSPLSFARHTLTLPNLPGLPAVSSVHLVDLDGDGRLDLLGTDMRRGVVFTGRPADAASPLAEIATIPYPARVTRADLDRDGIQDLLVSEMGGFFPADHDKGAVIWLRGLGPGKHSALWLDGWPRVADIQAADFNGDGRNELLVAAFGWRKTGHITLIESRETWSAQPVTVRHTIDKRSGALQTIPADLNGDGHLDFVTLLAQEHETVVAYINRGTRDFSFDPHVIYAAPHPNWGSSGLVLADIDGDGDLDALLAHGDTFDDEIVKPYHGIQLLENTGGYPWRAHTLAQMPGVHGIKAADMDRDGDLDVVAGALLAGGSDVDERTLPALVWLEQTTARTFVRHTIATGFPRHAALDAGDIDGDGDVDIVAGHFTLLKEKTAAWVEVWVNGGKKKN